jgi:hypothetical protein
MRNKLKSFFTLAVATLTGGGGKAAMMKMAVSAVIACMDAADGIKFVTWGNEKMEGIKQMFPHVFSNKTKLTPEEYKLYALGVAAEMLRTEYPNLSV